MTLRVKLTPFQREEVGHKIQVGEDEGWPEFAMVDGDELVISDLDTTIEEVENARDIYADNVRVDPGALGGQRSLNLLLRKLEALR